MRLNGWQRLWVIITVLAAVWFLVLWPVKTLWGADNGNRMFAASLAADYDGGLCKAYIERQLRDLAEPPYGSGGGTCWHLYTHRKVHSIDDVPYTRAKADRHESWETVKRFADVLLVGVIGLVLVSGGLYAFGVLIRWVRRGFAGSGNAAGRP